MEKFTLTRVAILCIALFALSATAAFASELDKTTADLVRKAPGKDKYPEANAIVLKSNVLFEFREDGTGFGEYHLLTKVLTDKGIKQQGEFKYPYYRTYDTVIVEIARVIKADGSVIDVPEDMIKDISSAMTEEMNIYEPDALEKVITFKGLEVGDCIELRLGIDLRLAPIEGHFDTYQVFQGFDPILSQEVVLIGPKSKPVRHTVRNGNVSFRQQEEGDKIRYIWSAKNVDRILQEPAMPALTEIAPTVYVTTIGSWEEISRWWHDMVEPKLAVNDPLRAEVAALIEGKETRDEKIDAIYRFVAQKIRYMGLGTGKKKGLEPKPATETYETRYGVCRDVAALMVAMLREADIESEVVLTNAGAEVIYDLPYIGFNHAIVAIRNDDGSYTYADPTIENSVAWLPAVESEQQVLVCTPKGETLDATPYTPARENMGEVKAKSRLNEDGLFVSDVTITTKGINDLVLRQMAKMIPKAQMSIVWSYLIQEVYPGIRLTDFTTSDPEDLTKPFEIQFSYQIPDYPTEAGRFVLMKSPVSTGAFELISRFLLATGSLPQRQYPWSIGFTFGASEEEVITLPPGMKIKSIPDPVSLAKGPIEYRMLYSATEATDLPGGGSEVTYKKEFMINSRKLSPAEYAQYKEIMKRASKSARGELILQNTAAEN